MIRLLVLGVLMVTWGSVECRPEEEIGNRILGGEDAGSHEFPEALLMISSLNNGSGYRCAASIINSFWGLTAGHCCLYHGYVLEGSSDQSQARRHDIKPGYCIAHEELGNETYIVNDIAVFKVATKFSLDGVTNKPIKLPEVGYSLPRTFEATAVGWGLDSWYPLTASEILQKIQLTVTETNIFGEQKFVSKASGGDSGTGLCHGDSGGPLYYNGIVVGVASYVSPGCYTPDYQNYHTIVSSYRTWIDKTILKYD